MTSRRDSYVYLDHPGIVQTNETIEMSLQVRAVPELNTRGDGGKQNFILWVVVFFQCSSWCLSQNDLLVGGGVEKYMTPLLPPPEVLILEQP